MTKLSAFWRFQLGSFTHSSRSATKRHFFRCRCSLLQLSLVLLLPVESSSLLLRAWTSARSNNDNEDDMPPQPPQLTKRRVCLFGLSADPPTGVGGHVGIVQALRMLLKTNRNNSSDDAVFDEVRVLPVYRHTYAVRAYIL
jgi:hypothetical protein